MTSPRHRIFVSHSHIDNEFGIRLTQDLRSSLTDDRAVFYDVLGGLHGGDTWWEKIIEELTARDVFLPILSPDAMNSIWVRREITIALHQNKLILPILHQSCTIRPDLEIIQNISFLAPKSYEAAFQEVLVALNLPLDNPTVQKKSISKLSNQANRLIQQVETAFAEHDWPDVIRKADYLMRDMPESMSSVIYRWQGVALMEEGKEQQAQKAFEAALALVSDSQERLTLLSDYTALLVHQKQWAEVSQRAKEALRFIPHDPAWLAIQQQAQNQLSHQVSKKSALQWVKQALRFVPHDPAESPIPLQEDQLFHRTPKISSSQKQEQTREEKSSSIPSKTREQLINEGNALYGLKRYDEALRAYDQASHLDPNDAVAYINKGIALKNLKRYEEALSAYEQAIRLDPNDANTYNNKGTVLKNLKRYEEALSAYEQAISLDPNDANTYNNKGSLLDDLKRYEEALSAYEQAIHLDPNDADTYINKGIALKNLKRYEEALSAYDQAIHLDPNDTVAYINKGIALNSLKRYEEALSAYEQAIHLDPNDAVAYNNKGTTLNSLKRYEEALSAYNQAIHLNPNYAVAYNNKGNTLNNLKRYEEALSAYEQATSF